MKDTAKSEIYTQYAAHNHNTLGRLRSRVVSVLCSTQSRIIGAVREAHSQLWGTIIPVCSVYAARKYDRGFGTPAIV